MTVFDGRIPHGVQQVEGTLDPLQGRIVAHGWFTEPSPFFAGARGFAASLRPCFVGCRTAADACIGAPTSSLTASPSLISLPAPPAGSLSEEDATPALNECLDELYEALGGLPPVVGVVTLRLDIAGDSGRVADIKWLANTLVARPQGGGDPQEATQETLATIAEHCFRASFPASGDGGATAITLPFVFE